MSSFNKGDFLNYIRENIISTNNFPRMIIGTGLSISYGIPGMSKLFEWLNSSVVNYGDVVKHIWEDIKGDIQAKGLEAGLTDARSLQPEFIDFIKVETVKLMIDENEHYVPDNTERGFSRLLDYLIRSQPINKSSLNIMTTNYDTIIEDVFDFQENKDCILVNGFRGVNYPYEDRSLLRDPFGIYKSQVKILRLFKPHGSIDWIIHNNKLKKVSKDSIGKYNLSKVQIITPGLGKHFEANSNLHFSEHKRFFNEELDSNNNPLIIYGYGFNDVQFDIKIFDTIRNKFLETLIISKEVSEEIVQRAMENTRITVLYSKEDRNYVVFNSIKHEVEEKYWDLDYLMEELI